MPDHTDSNFSLGGVVRRLAAWQRKSPSAVQRSQEEIQEWILDRVAQTLEMDSDEVDLRVPFADYGLDSRTAVGLSGELEKWLGLDLPPTLVWDYPTIEAMACYLAVESAAKFADSDDGG